MAPRLSLVLGLPLSLLLASVPGRTSSPALIPEEAALRGPSDGAYWVFFMPGDWAGAGPGGSASPAPAAIRDALRSVGVRIRTESRWLRAVSVEGDAGSIQTASRLPGVLGVRAVSTLESPTPGTVARRRRGCGRASGCVGAIQVLDDALALLGVPAAREVGLTGSGIRVGLLGSAARLDHEALADLDILAVRDFIDGDASIEPGPGEPLEEAGPSTAALFLMGGRSDGEPVGPAPAVSFVVARVDEVGSSARLEEDYWVAGLEWLQRQGVRIVVSLAGFREFDDHEYAYDMLDGDQIPATVAADEAALRGVLVVSTVGNGGPPPATLVAPADGDSVLSVGAADLDGRFAPFASRGPTADGRVSPLILAPGTELMAAGPLSPTDLVAVSGSQYAAALIGGVAALFVEAHPERGPVDIAGALISSTRGRADGLALEPVAPPDVASAIFFPDGLESLPPEDITADGDVTTLTPLFRWSAPTLDPRALPITFRLQLAEDSAFSDLVLQDSVVGAFARRPQRALPPRKELFFRVEAAAARGVTRRTAIRGPLRVPSWVTLLVLNDPAGVTIEEARPVLEWDALNAAPPAGPIVHEVQILSDRDREPLVSFPGLTETTFQVPGPLPLNTPLRWRVVAQAAGGGADTVTSAGPFVVTSGSRPPLTLLFQNYPNPFPREDLGRMVTRIWFDLAVFGEVTLAVYDLRGRLVRRLIPVRGCPPQELQPGLYGREEQDLSACALLHWDGRDDEERVVPRGVYLLRLRTPDGDDVRRMVFWP